MPTKSSNSAAAAMANMAPCAWVRIASADCRLACHQPLTTCHCSWSPWPRPFSPSTVWRLQSTVYLPGCHPEPQRGISLWYFRSRFIRLGRRDLALLIRQNLSARFFCRCCDLRMTVCRDLPCTTMRGAARPGIAAVSRCRPTSEHEFEEESCRVPKTEAVCRRLTYV